ncbi:hypothetical protein NQ318_014717 [Aromia moschata]|uniref:Gustatory receptor n=1 Tax=Aromia moschata TaxID=1265417 RepID=A0AAV8ZDR0_9CUCU|nr:hypothetical protein NQ318_014717 [Aromia moschata]
MKVFFSKKFNTVNDAINPMLMVSKLAAVCTVTKKSDKEEFVVSYILIVLQIFVSIINVAHLIFIPFGVIHLEKVAILVIMILISWPYQIYAIIMVTTNNWMAFVMFSLNLYNNFSIISCEFQFISLCWIIKARFTSINDELRALGVAILVDVDESILNKVHQIRRAYRVLNDSCVQLNILYSFQLLTMFSSLGLCILFNLYFAIFGGFKRDSQTMASEAKQVSGAMNDVIWSIYYFGRLFLICVAAGHLTEQVM